MIRGVPTLADQPVVSITTPRAEAAWLDLDDQAALRERIPDLGHSQFLLARGSLHDFVGVALAKHRLRDLLEEGRIHLGRPLRPPLVAYGSVGALRLTEPLRHSSLRIAVLLGEHGSIDGVVTPTGILEAVARTTPCLLALFSILALPVDRLPACARRPAAAGAWLAQPHPTALATPRPSGAGSSGASGVRPCRRAGATRRNAASGCQSPGPPSARPPSARPPERLNA